MGLPRVLSGVQPTGALHLGNWLGAIRNWVELQNDHDTFFCVVDLHAITVPHDPDRLAQDTLSTAALYLACGLDPERSTVFVQSQVAAHSELCWLLNCVTPLNWLERMIQFKEKAVKQGDNVSVGLLDYPVLMAADILLYNADLVPVGEDQRQHLELCRDLAQRFNHQYSETFVIPEPYVPKTGSRIMSLADPTRKMSKSDDNDRATLFILDEPDRIRKKIASAVTDSGSEIRATADKPGVSNLLTIHSGLSGRPVAELEEHFSGKGYGELKSELTELISESLAPVRSRYRELIEDKAYLKTVLAQGAAAAQKRAYKILAKVYRKVGFPERERN